VVQILKSATGNVADFGIISLGTFRFYRDTGTRA
jgi:hypothetical protein